jgi:hypothetical protein
MLIVVKKLAKRELVKQQWSNFITAWSSSIIREVGDIFNYNFKVGLQVHPLGYKVVNLGEITWVQKQVQLWVLAQMQARREVVASL